MIGVYPGSFDPCTNGHIDIIKRASKLVDKLYLVVAINKSKKCLFSAEERVHFLNMLTSEINNVEVYSYNGLIVDFANKVNSDVIIRGVRNNKDLHSEMEMAIHNNKLNVNVETIFLPSSPENSYITSSYVKEIAAFGGDVSYMVPTAISEIMKNLFK
jgi:pantetheine-phosphate adenylyltransferase